MRRIKFYSKKIIKYLFGIFVILILILLPVGTLLKKNSDDSGLSIIEGMRPSPSVKYDISYENGSSDEIGYHEDIIFNLDEDSFNDYTITDYVISISRNSVSSDYIYDKEDPLVWTPDFTTEDEAKNSLAFDKMRLNTYEDISKDDYDNDYDYQLANQQRLVEELVANPSQYIINGGETLITMYETDYKYTLDCAFEFTLYDENDVSTSTMIIDGAPLTLEVIEDKRDIQNKEVTSIIAPEITFDDTLQKVTISGIATSKHNEISGLFNTSQASYLNLLENTYQPMFAFQATNLNSAQLDIFEQVPTISVDMWLSEDSKTSISEGDIQIINTSVEMTKWAVENKWLKFEPTYLGGFDGMYDDTNTLVKTNAKIRAEINYQYKTAEEINELYPGATITTGVDGVEFTSEPQTASINLDDKYTLADADGLEIFNQMAQFDRSDTPEFVIYPNWDDSGRFNIIFATEDQYIFASDDYDNTKALMKFNFNCINQRTGEKAKIELFVSNFRSTSEYSDEEVYYTTVYPMSTFLESEEYYLSSESAFEEYIYYTPNHDDSMRTYDSGLESLRIHDESPRSTDYSNFIFTDINNLESAYDKDKDGIYFVTSNNFHEISSHSHPDYKEIAKYLVLFILLFVLIPLTIYVIFRIRNTRL